MSTVRAQEFGIAADAGEILLEVGANALWGSRGLSSVL